MNLKVLLFAGIPEVISTLIITILFLDKQALLNLKNRLGIIKLIAASLICTIFTYLLKSIFGNYQYVNNFVVQLVFYVLVISILANIKWYYISISLTLVFICFGILETANLLFNKFILGYSVDQMMNNENLRILLFLPFHLLQIFTPVVLLKVPGTLLSISKIEKWTSLMKKKLTLINVLLIVSLINILFTLKIFVLDLQIRTTNEIIMLCVNLSIISVLALTLLYTSKKFTKTIQEEKENNIIQLEWFKSILGGSNDVNRIKESINEEIKKKKEA